MKHLSLCTGYGGLDLAVDALFDSELVALAEFDKHASTICAIRFPGVPNLGDITTIDWSSLGDIDLITAGYPCQPFSLAGKRKGADDARHIWPHIAEAVRVLRPRWVVLENVYGHLSKGFGAVLGALAALGYDSRWACLRASDVGAPHRRERVFIIASNADLEPAGGGSAPSPSPQSQDAGWREPEVDHRSEDETGGGRLLPTPAALIPNAGDLLPTPTASDSTGPGHAAQGGRNLRTEVTLLPTPTAVQSRSITATRYTPNPKVTDGTTLNGVAYANWWGRYTEAIARWEQVMGLAPSPSEDNGKGGRRLNPVFVEWMMGLPPGWVTDTGIPRTAQLKALGNGVVPQQAYAALRGLLDG